MGDIKKNTTEHPRAPKKTASASRAKTTPAGTGEASSTACGRANLGRPNPNEDKDMNLEQFKGRTKGRANPKDAQLAQVPTSRQSAERVDPTGRRRAGERH